MFNKRKYNSKTNRRRTFRPRVRKKGVILRPIDLSVLLHPNPEFDKGTLAAPYVWQYHLQNHPIFHEVSRKKVSSLKLICASVVAANADALEPSLLHTCSWSCWKDVWRMICERHQDLPYVFGMFANKFGNLPDFNCHNILNDHTPRAVAITSMLAPHTYRLDNVFSNIAHKDFVAFLSGVDANIIIDCSSSTKIKRDEVLNFCNIRGLSGLDLSNNEWVDDQFLYTLGRAITHKELTRFRYLRLIKCSNLSRLGLVKFLREFQKLVEYVATDIDMLEFLNRPGNLTGNDLSYSKWDLLLAEDDRHKFLNRNRLGKAAQYLMRSTYLLDAHESPIVWEIKFFSTTVDSREPDELYSKLRIAWNEREKLSTPRPSRCPYHYIKTTTVTQPTSIQPKVEEIASTQQESNSAITHRKPKRRPTVRLKNTDQFFGLR